MDILPDHPQAKKQDPSTITHKEVSPEESTVLGLSFAWELGYTIAVPAILFCVGGAKLDRYLGTGHWMFFLGLMISLVVSFVGVYRKIRFIMRRMPKDLPRKKKKHRKSIDPEIAKEQEVLHALFRPPSDK